MTVAARVPEARPALLDRGARMAVLSFAVVAAAAIPLYLWAGRDQWFASDEWDFLGARSVWSANDLLRPHNEHWTTLPIVVYRGLWAAFGLRSYWPYQLVSILSHLALAAMLLLVMRRAKVAPWIASVAASAFVLFGAGAQNILWGFQITFTFALVFGLVQLVLADHDGPLGRRDWLGLVAGLAALMSSGVGVSMVLAVGVAAMVRRGWRAAAFHTVPLAGVCVLWWATFGRDGDTGLHSRPDQIVAFVANVLRSSFRTFGSLPLVGLLLALLMVSGLVLLWATGHRPTARRRTAPALGLLGGVVAFTVVTGWSRAYFGTFDDASRYLHVVVAMCLPALGLAIDAWYRRWPLLGYLGLGLIVAGVPGNVQRTTSYLDDYPNLRGRHDLVQALAWVVDGQDLSRGIEPLGTDGPGLTVGWLQDGLAAGKIPREEPGKADRAAARWLLAFEQTAGDVAPDSCPPLTRPEVRALAAGDEIVLSAGQLLVRPADGEQRPRFFVADDGAVLRAQYDVAVQIEPRPGYPLGARVCR